MKTLSHHVACATISSPTKHLFITKFTWMELILYTTQIILYSFLDFRLFTKLQKLYEH